MLAALFDRITRLSVKYYVVTLALALVISILGIMALRDLNLELLPRIEFPQTIVVVQWSEAETADNFADEITIPLENALGEVEGVVNVESTSVGPCRDYRACTARCIDRANGSWSRTAAASALT